MSANRPKRARTGQLRDGSGPSQSRTPAEVAADRKALIEPKKFIPERYFALASVPELDMYRGVMSRLGWMKFGERPMLPHIKNVRDFYMALPEAEEDVCHFRNHAVSFTSSTINKVLGTRDIPPDLDPYELLRDNTPWDMIDHVLTHGQGAYHPEYRRTLRSRCMSREAKVWNMFIQKRIFPSANDSDLLDMHQRVLFCVLTHQNIDVGRIINEKILEIGRSILEGTMTTNALLPYPSLITALCHEAGVPMGGPKGEIGKKIDRASILKNNGAPGTLETPTVSFYQQHWGRRGLPEFQPPPPMPPFQFSQAVHEEDEEPVPEPPREYPKYDDFFRDARWLSFSQGVHDHIDRAIEWVAGSEHRQNAYQQESMQHMFSRLSIANYPPIPDPYQWPPPPQPYHGPEPASEPAPEEDSD